MLPALKIGDLKLIAYYSGGNYILDQEIKYKKREIGRYKDLVKS